MNKYKNIAYTALLGAFVLSSCVQGDLYDDLYDEDMPSWMMIGRRKFKNDNGDNGNNGNNDPDPYDWLHEGLDDDPWGEDTGGQSGGQTDTDPIVPRVQDPVVHIPQTLPEDNLPPMYNVFESTSAYRYLNGRMPDEVFYRFSLDALHTEISERTLSSAALFTPDKIMIYEVTTTSNDVIKSKNLMTVSDAEKQKIRAHKECGGAYFEDDHSGFVYMDPDQVLEIYLKVAYEGKYKYAGCKYHSVGYNSSGSFSGTYSHTHPNIMDNQDQLSEEDRKFSSGGLDKEAWPVAADRIKEEVKKLSFVVDWD